MIGRSVRARWRAAPLVSALALGACVQDAVLARARDGAGSDAADDGARDGLPRVEGDIIASVEVESAGLEPSVEVRFSLRVSVEGGALSDASVSVESSLGTVTLSPSDGRFIGAQRGYAQRYALVLRAQGREWRASLSGPAAHRVEQPAPGQRVRAGAPLAVRWSPSGAAEASVETEQLSETPVADTGSFEVPASALAGASDRSTEDRVRVTRVDTAALAGFGAGSRLRVVVRYESPFVIEPR
jgi:hypothetical protein